MDGAPTGAACILVDAESGENAIIIAPGAALSIGPADVEAQKALFQGASVFVTQLEQPLDAAVAGLKAARAAGATTILNPAPAMALDDAVLALCDYLTPNESEAELLTGLPVSTLNEAKAAAHALRARGVGTVLMTLGEKGALLVDERTELQVPALSSGAVVETTGAGDAFNGGFAVGLAEGLSPEEAARFGAAVAGISVTRPGAAASMPTRAEIEALLAKG
jgi:ribokinase